MNTGYKTRAYYALRSLTYAHDVEWAYTVRKFRQADVWHKRAHEEMEAAFSPSGDERLTPSASYLADRAAHGDEHEPMYPC